jgi:hypothetical protein
MIAVAPVVIKPVGFLGAQAAAETALWRMAGS